MLLADTAALSRCQSRAQPPPVHHTAKVSHPLVESAALSITHTTPLTLPLYKRFLSASEAWRAPGPLFILWHPGKATVLRQSMAAPALLTAALVARPAPLLPLWASEGAPWSRFERLTFESESKLNRFHSQFAPLLSSVQANESNMLSFAVLLSDEDPLSVLVLERYARSQAYFDGHCTTQAYLDFTPKLDRLQPNSSLSTYNELDIGFYGRNGTDTFTLTDSRLSSAWSLAVELTFSSDAKVTQMLEAIVPLVDYVKKSEPTTLGYKVMRGDKDPLKVMIMERYVDKDDAYLKVHRSSKEFLDFKRTLRELAPEVDGHSFHESPFLSVGPER